MSPILVTGAAGGEQGSTGRHVVKLLRDRGLPVRAFVHRIENRCDALKAWGAEVVAGDLLDACSVRAAMRDIRRAYFIYPVRDGLLEATTNVAAAGKDAGLECLVEVGYLNSDQNAASPRTRQQWQSERVFDWAGVGAVHLRAAVFYSNLRAFGAGSIPGTGLLRLLTWVTGTARLCLPTGDGTEPIPFVAGEDVARVAAAILAEPAPHVGKTYLVSGPLRSLREAAAAFASVLGRRIEYMEISKERFRSALAERMPENPLVVQHLTVLWGEVLGRRDRTDLARLAAPAGGVECLSDAVRTIGGREPMSLEEDLRQHLPQLAIRHGSRRPNQALQPTPAQGKFL